MMRITSRLYALFVLVFALFGLLSAAACQAEERGRLAISCAYVVPDMIPAELTADRKPRRHRGATLFAYVRNEGSRPVRFGQIKIDGVEVTKLREKRIVAWWRVRPRLLRPQRIAEVTVRLQRVFKPEIKLTIETELPRQSLSALVGVAVPKLRIVNVAFSRELKEAYLVVKLQPDYEAQEEAVRGIARVYLDGVDVTSLSERPGLFKSLAPVVVRLDEPFRHGSFHVFTVVDTKGRETAAGVRAWPTFFELGTFGNHYFKDFAQASFNTYQSFGPLSKKTIDAAHALGLYMTAPYFRARNAYFLDKLDLSRVREAVNEVKGHAGLLAYYLEDEPDCFDWRYCGCFAHWFDLTFPKPVSINRLVIHELRAYSKECVVECQSGGKWRTVAKKDERQISACEKSKGGRRIEFQFAPMRVRKLRISIPRSSHMPGIRELEVYDVSGRNVAGSAKARASSRFLAWYGRSGDEPAKAIDGDLKTSWRASHSIPEWVGATAMEMIARAEFYQSLDPRTLTTCLVDNTYTPANWFTYGQLADIFDTDPYVRPSRRRKANFYSVYRRSVLACRASEPNPCFITLWMGWVGGHRRCYTESEERIMVCYALGAGARGINYFIHSSSAGDYSVMTGVLAFPKGPERERARKQALALWEGVARINSQLSAAGKWLAYAYPVDAILKKPSGVWARALLCANGAMVVVLVNQNHNSTVDAFEVEPIDDVTIEIAAPHWLPCNEVSDIMPNTARALQFQKAGDRAAISVGAVRDGKLIVIR
ncbi:MAG: hypothetical protein ACTSX8_09965 [Alphaproteobacteria bacterium]